VTAAGLPTCECDGSGFVVDEATNTARDCTCRARRRTLAKARRLEARLPKRYQHVAFDRSPVVDMHETIVRQARRFTRDIDRNLDAGRGIWFVGAVGTGKTTLAMLVSKSAIEAGRSVAIYSLPRLLGVLRESMTSEAGMLRLVDDLSRVDLLHLDDLGAERATEWVLEQLYAIVNARYEEQRSLVITTNLEPDQLAEQLGPRIVSRIWEMCGDPVLMQGEDQRTPAGPAVAYETSYAEELERRVAGMRRGSGES
jgi:DNA replication protein DnaC